MNPHDVLLYPLMGEKATSLREKENRLTFIVEKKSSKKEIKEAVESLYSVEVLAVNTMITLEGKKKAHVKLSSKYSADEIASRFGIL